MLVTTSQALRSLVVRLHRGEDLAESLAGLIASQRIAVATVHGHGVLEAVILDAYDARAKAYTDARTFTGRLELLSLEGHLSTREGSPDLYLHATVARDTGNGVEVVGGRLIEAQVVAVELTLLLHDDLALERAPEASGIPTWRVGGAPAAETGRSRRSTSPDREPAPAPAPSTSPRRIEAAKPVTLAEVAQQLQAMPAKPERAVDDDEGAVLEVAAGDVLEHPTFGDATVVRLSDDDRCDIKLLRSGSFRTIALDYFEIVAQPARDGHRVWKLTPRHRR